MKKTRPLYLPKGDTFAKIDWSSYVTNADSLDRELAIFTAGLTKFQMLVADDQHQYMTDLLVDAFAMFYKHAPRVKEAVPVERLLNRDIIRNLETLPEYRELRDMTRGDEFNSMEAVESLFQVMQRLPWEMRDLQEQLEDTLSDDPHPGSKVPNESDKQRQKRQEQLAKDIGSDINASLTQHDDAVRQSIRKGMEGARKQIEAIETATNALGWGTESAALGHGPLVERLEIARKLRSHSNLRKLMELAGRFINIAREKQAERVETERDEVESVEEGADLPDVMPDEFIKLMDPTLEDLFYKQFFEGKLQQYKLTAKRPRNRGAIYVAIDCSGSMTDRPDRNHFPDTWSKAVALAMYQIARDQHRDFHGCLFNNEVRQRVAVKAGKPMAIEMLSTFFGAMTSGGTDFDRPLAEFALIPLWRPNRGVSLNENVAHTTGDVDLIFITDGDCECSDALLEKFNKERKEKKFHVYSVLIGAHGRHVEELMKFSDKVISLEGRISDRQDAAFEIVFSV